ncbi:MAG TPA: hypothetical protein VH741_08170, partial [Candidatus Limnocylindrales bacterium]
MGKRTVAATMIIVGLASAPERPLREISGASMAQASSMPMASHPPEPAAASMNTLLDGFCCRAKMRPPMDGASSLAATRARGGAAARRRGGGVAAGAGVSAGLASGAVAPPASGGDGNARRAAKRRPAAPPRARVAANDDAPSIGGLIFALQQKPSNRVFML